MKKYLLAGFLFTASLPVFSQVPGFQGKKFIIKYDLGIMHPIIVGRTGALPMFYNNLTMDYTVSRAWTIGVKYGFMTYKAPPDRQMFFGGQYSYESDADPKQFKGRYTQHTVSVFAKKFFTKRGYIAPVGRYMILGLYYQYAVDHLVASESYTDYNTGETTSKVTGYKTTAHFGGFTIGMGRNFVVARRMLIDIGFVLNVPPYFIINGYGAKSAAWRDLILRNLFQINVGLGVLAF